MNYLIDFCHDYLIVSPTAELEIGTLWVMKNLPLTLSPSVLSGLLIELKLN